MTRRLSIIVRSLAFLVAFALLATQTAAAATPSDAKGAASKLPGFANLALQKLSAAADGKAFKLLSTKSVDIHALKGKAGWHGTILPKNAKRVGLRMLGRGAASLGLKGAEQVAVVSSSAADTLALETLPAPVKAGLSAFADSKGGLKVGKGINLFVKTRVSGAGTLPTALAAMGVAGGSIVISGLVGDDVFTGVAALAGAPRARGKRPQIGTMALSVKLPKVVPAPFNTLNDKNAAHVELRDVALTFSGNRNEMTFSGAMAADVWMLGKQVSIPSASLTMTRKGAVDTLKIAGKAVIDLKDAFGLPGVELTGLGIDATLTNDKSKPASNKGMTLGLTVDTKLPGMGVVSGALNVDVAKAGGKTELKELRIGLKGALPLKSFGPLASVPVVKEITINDPAIGLMPTSKEGFISGGLSWPAKGLSTTGVIYARNQKGKKGAALFVEAKGFSLKKLMPQAKLPVDLTFPQAVIVLSALKMDNIPVKKLPSPAAAMIKAIGMTSEQNVSAADGLTFLTTVDTSKAPFAAAAKALGTTQPLVVAGSIGGITTKKPSFQLYADLPVLPVPAALKSNPVVALENVQPKLFFALGWGAGPEMSLGIETRMGLKLDGQPIKLAGKLYAVLGASGAGLKVTGKLIGAWNNPFGLQGIGISDATVSLGVAAQGAVDVAIGGTARFDKLSYTLAGTTKVLFSSGIPTIQGIGLHFKGTEVGPLVPLKIGKTLFASSTGVLKGAIPKKLAPIVAKANGFDIVAEATKRFPLSQLKLRDVEFFIATPGMTHPDFPQFNGMGIKIKGTAKYANRTLGAIDSYLTANDGFKLAASLGAFALGPVSLKKAAVDVLLPIPGPGAKSPRFMVKGDAKLLGTSTNVGIHLTPKKVFFNFKQKWGALDVAKLRFTSTGTGIPKDFSLSMKAQPGNMQKAIGQALQNLVTGGAGSSIAKAISTAETRVTNAQKGIKTARKTAEADRKKATSGLSTAQKAVTAANNKVKSLNKAIKSTKSKISKELKKVVPPPDPVKLAAWGAKVVALEASKKAAQVTLAAAKKALQAAKSGVTWFPIDAHPAVVAAFDELNQANIELEILKATQAGLKPVGDAAKALTGASVKGVKVQSIALSGPSLSQLLKGKKATLTVKMKVHKRNVTAKYAFALTTPKSFDIVALATSIFNQTQSKADAAKVASKVKRASAGGQLMAYLHTPGTKKWAKTVEVATGWGEFLHVVGGWSGHFYAVAPNKELLFYKHTGWAPRDKNWTVPKKIGAGWDFKRLISTGEQGYIYAIKKDGKLFRYTDKGGTGAGNWAPTHQIGNGWNQFTHVFGGWYGTLYAVAKDGTLKCYKDQAPNKNRKKAKWIIKDIAKGWNKYVKVFGGDGGHIYGITKKGALEWHQHTGPGDCSKKWAPKSGLKVGGGWNIFKHVMLGSQGRIYGIKK